MTFAEYIEKFKTEYEAFIKDFCETGAAIAQQHYGEGNGEDSASVSAEADGGTGRIVATGDGISFLEFGAGVDAGITGLTPVQAPYQIAPGTWSREHSKQFYLNGFWFYNGKRYYSKTPTGAMQNASIEVQQRVQEIAGRNFG